MTSDATIVTTDTRTRHTRSRWLRHVFRAIVYLLTLILAILFLIPFLWTVSSAFKPSWELYIFPPNLLPMEWQPENFVRIWQLVPFARWTANTLYVTILSVIGQVLSASAVAYGFARFDFRGRDVLFMLVLSTMMLPIYITIIPLFVGYSYIGWTDTLYPLWVPAFLGGGAFNIFLLRQFFMTIPRDFDEAAYVDGASSWTIFWRVIMPLSKPALSTVAIFGFLGSWSAFLLPLIILSSSEKFTLSLGMTWFQVIPMDGEPRDHLLMAASATITLPVVILFFASQRYFIEGIVMTGIKG